MTTNSSCQTTNEEKEELLQQKRIMNRNRVLYKNLRKILNDARQYSDVVNYENELFCLKGVLFGVEKRIAELEQRCIGIPRHEDLERTCKYCNIPVLKSIYKQHLQSEEHQMNVNKQSGDSVE